MLEKLGRDLRKPARIEFGKSFDAELGEQAFQIVMRPQIRKREADTLAS